MAEPLILRQAGLRLALAPDLGGSVLSFTRLDQDLLRPTPCGATDVLQTACFPLAPYANRIAHGRFTFGGRTAQLAPNMAGQVHPLHGDGWRGAWRVEALDGASATLAFDPKDSAWPWLYSARQTIRLTPRGLVLDLEVTNRDTAPGPFGIGFHPYFPNAATARLTAATAGAWMTDADLLPTRWAAGAPFADWSAGAAVRGPRLVDHCHTGWTGDARIDPGGEGAALRLTASPELCCLHIYAPPGEDVFCVEPVSHVPNAVNAPDAAAAGMRILAPGESLRGWMRLRVVSGADLRS